MLATNFGLSLRRAREARGLSMFALAKAARMNRSTVQRLERGVQDPSAGTARKLERVLDQQLTPAYLRDHVRDDEVTRYVTQHHPQGLTVDQVGIVLRLSPRSVKTALARALRKLFAPVHDITPEGDAVRLWRARLRERVQQQHEQSYADAWPGGLDQVDEDEASRPLDWWCGDHIGEDE